MGMIQASEAIPEDRITQKIRPARMVQIGRKRVLTPIAEEPETHKQRTNPTTPVTKEIGIQTDAICVDDMLPLPAACTNVGHNTHSAGNSPHPVTPTPSCFAPQESQNSVLRLTVAEVITASPVKKVPVKKHTENEPSSFSLLTNLQKAWSYYPTSRAEYLAQQKVLLGISLAHLKATREELLKKNEAKNEHIRKQELELQQLRYTAVDDIYAYLRNRGHVVDTQEEIDQVKTTFKESHAFFQLVMKTIEAYDNLTDEEVYVIRDRFIRPVEEFEDSMELPDTTADDLVSLIQKTEKRLTCPCLKTGAVCKKCDLINLRAF